MSETDVNKHTCAPFRKHRDCGNQKVGCQEFLAREREIAYFRDNFDFCTGRRRNPGQLTSSDALSDLFGPTHLAAEFQCFLHCNHYPEKCFEI